ncbi:unnamed protein product [Closterium sp. Naga37s-1]|nr:unnamed protein product [Closterium sp. Naga37s-1]
MLAFVLRISPVLPSGRPLPNPSRTRDPVAEISSPLFPPPHLPHFSASPLPTQARHAELACADVARVRLQGVFAEFEEEPVWSAFIAQLFSPAAVLPIPMRAPSAVPGARAGGQAERGAAAGGVGGAARVGAALTPWACTAASFLKVAPQQGIFPSRWRAAAGLKHPMQPQETAVSETFPSPVQLPPSLALPLRSPLPSPLAHPLLLRLTYSPLPHCHSLYQHQHNPLHRSHSIPSQLPCPPSSPPPTPLLHCPFFPCTLASAPTSCELNATPSPPTAATLGTAPGCWVGRSGRPWWDTDSKGVDKEE